MSFEINKIYTENPYVDELVYYTKIMSLNTTLKFQQLADSLETAESLKKADLYIACVEGTAIFEIFPKVTRSALKSAGIVLEDLIKECLRDKNKVPENKRARVAKALSEEYIRDYEDLNPYYRMLNGLPEIGREDHIEDWEPPDGIIIDTSKPIHMMNDSELEILNQYHVIENMIEEEPSKRQYMKHLGKNKIDYYTARKAGRFDVLFIPPIESQPIYDAYKEKLDANKFYVLRAVYSEAFNYESDYYDNFIAVLIIVITMVDMISRVQEFIARKEIFDIRSVQYIFKSNGIPFYEEIPLKYQIAMVKNLHTLLKYKSTKKCMIDICALFGFKNIKIFKYYLLKDRKVDISTGEYIYAKDAEGNEDIEAEYDLKFLKLPLEDDLDDYVMISGNYIDYDEITEADESWDGGLDHTDVAKDILKEEFNFIRTKYISIDTVYDIAKMSIQQSYFFNFLYDNVYLENMLSIQVPFIEFGKFFNIGDIFTLLTILAYRYKGYKDTIMDTQSKVLYVNGFNFRADLAKLSQELSKIMIYNKDTINHIKQQIDGFIIPKNSIPSMNEMMNIFINNYSIRSELIKGMHEADDINIYNIYKKLYDSLMIIELTFDYYKNPETNDLYRDEDGDATYTEFLKHRDPTLYATILEMDSISDHTTKNQYIANLIDNIIWSLEEFIDSQEFQSLYSNLPVISTEVVKSYIATVIGFYKSFKIDFLGLNTIYTLSDRSLCSIDVIDGILKLQTSQRSEYISGFDKIGGCKVTSNLKDGIHMSDRVYIMEYDEESENNLMSFANSNDRNRIILADYNGDSMAKSYITNSITGNSDNVVTEKAAYDYINSKSGVTKDKISTTTPENANAASDSRIASEKSFVDTMDIKIIK